MWWIVVGGLVGAVTGCGTRRMLGGFTRDAPIPLGWCEAACAAGFAAVTLRVGWSPALVPAFALVWWMLAASVVDLRVRRLPNALTLLGGAAIVGFALGAGEMRGAVAGALMLAGSYLVLHLVAPSGMGAGDVKLAIGLGAVTGMAGASAWLLAAALAPVLSALVGVARRRAGDTIAHGPSMCAATAVALWCL
ncbi:prepilin peptidase [Prescottella agglutinans]|uniref:Prepilin peptidase n=2 Tax=Prescottella agglutinans TaxID=1644129 RepID=A0A438B8C3_9NOCA|nr:prepilin peptidase [Prescottella agglutinans]